MATFPHAEKIPFWPDIFKKVQSKGQKVANHAFGSVYCKKKGFCGKTKIRNEKCYPKPENWFGICWRGLFTLFFLQVNETK